MKHLILLYPLRICYNQQIIKIEMEIKQKINRPENTQLKNIAEITEEYNQTIKGSVITKKIKKHFSTSTQPEEMNPLFIQKYIKCFRYLLSICFKKEKKHEFDVNQSQMTKQVQKIKKKKYKLGPLLPPSESDRLKTLVLDLDQTLIHTSFLKTKTYDFTTEIEVNGRLQKVWVTKRFGLDIFLFQMSQLYEIVIFTAGLKDYTDKVIANIDSRKRINYILYRQQCTVINKSYYLKNLKLLGRNLKQTLLIDDNSMAGLLNPEIFYKIEPFYGDQKDKKLLRLIQLLKIMAVEDNFQCLMEKRKNFEAKNQRPCSYLNHDVNLKKRQSLQTPLSKLQASENNTLIKTQSFSETESEISKNTQI